MLVDWHLASPVLSSKPAAYLSSGLICPCMFPLNLILPGSRIILKAKNNMDVTLLVLSGEPPERSGPLPLSLAYLQTFCQGAQAFFVHLLL